VSLVVNFLNPKVRKVNSRRVRKDDRTIQASSLVSHDNAIGEGTR